MTNHATAVFAVALALSRIVKRSLTVSRVT
jgi:hypothetical protein